ncbi:hypothetical protein HZS_2704 [Henneguya salminicola]|nr:hypothetical protein HZS_2704 [Henneguya salminicola]
MQFQDGSEIFKICLHINMKLSKYFLKGLLNSKTDAMLNNIRTLFSSPSRKKNIKMGRKAYSRVSPTTKCKQV